MAGELGLESAFLSLDRTGETEQGRAMVRPGRVTIRLGAEGDEVTRVQVSGHATLAAEGV